VRAADGYLRPEAALHCRRRAPPSPDAAAKVHQPTGDSIPMRNRTLLAFALLALLGACHTTAGMGEDISRTGKTIERSAVRAAP
jgi:predicted small secreted protein